MYNALCFPKEILPSQNKFPFGYFALFSHLTSMEVIHELLRFKLSAKIKYHG